MMTPFKWTFVSIVGLVFMLVVVYASSMQNLTTRSTGEVEVLKEALAVGEIRSEIDEQGMITETHLSKDELIANFIGDIVSVQKTHPYDIQLDYVFYDKSGKITDDEKEIRSVQFRIQYVNDEGEVKGTAERHLAINQLSN